VIDHPSAGVLNGLSEMSHHHRATPPWLRATLRCVVCRWASADTFDLPKELFQDWLLSEAAHEYGICKSWDRKQPDRVL